MSSLITSPSKKTLTKTEVIPLREADSKELERISREGLLSLSLTEMKAIQNYFVKIERDPTDVELETLAQTWSEHCVHKTFKGEYAYKEDNAQGQTSLAPAGSKSYSNLLKETIMQTTEVLNHPWCLSVFKDNAGVIEFDETDGVSFKVETHNHPSALEPYGGAGTGIGGVIRDVLGCGLGGKPVLNTDVFCFGELDTQSTDLPEGALHPKRIAKGVVAGVRDYGNRMGIPTANGAIYFDHGYTGNPLVFCGTAGLQPKNTIDKHVEPGDLVVAVGGRTGRDGIHGATFSSAPLESGITSNVVQIGHAIMEKKFMDVLLQARNKGLYRSITDCGAGGFSSAIGELGEETGVVVNIDLAPLKYDGLAPWEIWVSESQERMVLAVAPDKWNSLRVLFQQEDVEATVIGEFTNDQKLIIKNRKATVAQLDMKFLHKGIPKLKLNAKWNKEEYFSKHVHLSKATTNKKDPSQTLKNLLSHPIIASKESVIRQYDHEVQGATIIKPLMGKEHDGPMDACVIRPKLSSWRGVGISNGLNPEVGKIDPYVMAKLAIDEAYRNLISVSGGLLKDVAILDNFCWGDAKDALELGGLVRAAEGCKEAALAFKLPFISGKDSFNNTWRTKDGKIESIPPTLLISAIGIISDVRHCITSDFKCEKSLIYLVGDTQNAMRGSLAQKCWGTSEGHLPDINFQSAIQLYKKLQAAMKYKTVLSCHDVSEGGLAVTLCEMAIGGMKGAILNLSKLDLPIETFLFGESPSRFVVEVSQEQKEEFEQTMGQRTISLIGETTAQPNIEFKLNNTTILKESLTVLKNSWKKPLGTL